MAPPLGAPSVGSLLGTAVAVVVYALLRRLDPECVDPRGHGTERGRCWPGAGPGDSDAVPVAVGALAWIVAYFLCMSGAWSAGQEALDHRPGPEPVLPLPPVLAAPLVTAHRHRPGGVPHRGGLTTLRWLHEHRRAPRSTRPVRVDSSGSGTTGPTRRVVVVDDHELLRAGTRQILEDAAGFTVVGEAEDGDRRCGRSPSSGPTSSWSTSGSPRPTGSTWPARSPPTTPTPPC